MTLLCIHVYKGVVHVMCNYCLELPSPLPPQVRSIPVQSTTEDGELDDEAQWIYQQAFCKPPITKQVSLATSRCALNRAMVSSAEY